MRISSVILLAFLVLACKPPYPQNGVEYTSDPTWCPSGEAHKMLVYHDCEWQMVNPGELAPNKCDGKAPKWVWYICPEAADPSLMPGMLVYASRWVWSLFS